MQNWVNDATRIAFGTTKADQTDPGSGNTKRLRDDNFTPDVRVISIMLSTYGAHTCPEEVILLYDGDD